MNRRECQDLALQFLYNQQKPEWARPLDILLTANVILLCNEEMACYASQGLLAAMSGIKQTDNVAKSLEKLVAHGWLTKNSRKAAYRTDIYYPQLHNLPLGGFRQSVISEPAKTLAARYREMVKLVPKKLSRNGRWYGVRVEKGWPQHWAFVMQQWLDTGWSEKDINRVVDHAFSEMPDTAKHGPQTL
jgi:hypothetical protein